jgi:cobalt-zinc-cadmium efflux system outer membrane protein
MRVTIKLLLIFFAWPNLVIAQPVRDTIAIALPDAEALFVKNNLALLAQKYSIDSAQAAVITARLYDNPELGMGSGFYDAATHRLFDYRYENKEISLQLSQLIKTAGKRNKAISLAETGQTLTQYQFFDLLRTLKYSVRNDFFNIYFLQQSQKVYEIEINALQKTVSAYKEQVPKGNIAPKELLRLQSQLYTLQAELASLQNAIDDVESEFKLLLRISATAYVLPLYDPAQRAVSVADFNLKTLLDSADQNRYDLKIARTNLSYCQQNLALQKALAVPDLTISGGYDRLGSYVKDYNYLGISIPLPVFSRNQGNIKQARIAIQSGQVQLDAINGQVESQIANAYLGAVRAEQLLKSIDASFEDNFNKLVVEVSRNFEKRNLSLLEFIDFYDSYKQNAIQLNNLRFNLLSQMEQLNFTTGTHLFN